MAPNDRKSPSSSSSRRRISRFRGCASTRCPTTCSSRTCGTSMPASPVKRVTARCRTCSPCTSRSRSTWGGASTVTCSVRSATTAACVTTEPMSDTTQPSGVRRREFLKILGVTGAGAAAGCGPSEAGRLIPYLVSPDQTVPGVSTYYATTCRECAAACGVIAETRDGRAIKLEGNPEHPLNRGALCARGQAALQGLYNPDRYNGPRVRRDGQLVEITWQEAVQLFRQRVDEARSSGRGADAVFLNRHETGSFPFFLDQWLSGMGLASHLAVDSMMDHAAIAANREAYGVAWPSLSFADARLIVSIGADFLDAWGASVPQQLDFAEARAKMAGAPRLVYIGARRSLTGLNADEWIPARSGSELTVANALLAAVRGGGRADMAAAAQAADVPVETLQRLGSELAAARPSLVLSGVSTVQARDVARAVNAINQAAGNVGVTIRPAAPVS